MELGEFMFFVAWVSLVLLGMLIFAIAVPLIQWKVLGIPPTILDKRQMDLVAAKCAMLHLHGTDTSVHTETERDAQYAMYHSLCMWAIETYIQSLIHFSSGSHPPPMCARPPARDGGATGNDGREGR